MISTADVVQKETAALARKKSKKPKKVKAKPQVAVGTIDDIKLGQELSASILAELSSSQTNLTNSYAGGKGSLPMGFVWPVETAPEIPLVPKPKYVGPSKFYPPSEYKENYIVWPVPERQRNYAPDENACPITLAVPKSTKDWKTVGHLEFVDFTEELAATECEPAAGCPPAEDIGKYAPAFFAWGMSSTVAGELNTEVDGSVTCDETSLADEEDLIIETTNSAPVASASDGMATNITESQENYIWQNVYAEKVSSPASEFDPYFLAEEDGPDSSTWITESQAVNELTTLAKTSEEMCGNEGPIYGLKQSSNEVYPQNFAWSRVAGEAEPEEILNKTNCGNIIVTAEQVAKSTPMASEYSSQYRAPSKSMKAKKLVQRETQLQVHFCPSTIHVICATSCHQLFTVVDLRY